MTERFEDYRVCVFRDKTTDDDGHVYIARIQELDGCFAQGDTKEEAMANLEMFFEEYVQHYQEYDLTLPKPADLNRDAWVVHCGSLS